MIDNHGYPLIVILNGINLSNDLKLLIDYLLC